MKNTNEVPKQTDEKGQPMTYWGGKKESNCICNDNTCDYCEEQESIQILKEAKEQATEQKKLEEFALKYADGNGWNTLTIESVKAGAKWQQENIPIKILDCDNIYAHVENGFVIIEKKDKDKRIFSQEEVYNLLLKYQNEYSYAHNEIGLKKWFKENKNK